MNNFQGAPNIPKSPSVCIRCGGPWHFVKDFPRPYLPVSDPKFPPGALNSAMKPVVHFDESPSGNESKKPNEIDTVLNAGDSAESGAGGNVTKRAGNVQIAGRILHRGK